MKDVSQMFKIFSEKWTKENVDFFGVQARNWDQMSLKDIEENLKADSENYWNSDNLCEMASLVLNGTICRDSDKIVDKSFKLIQNNISECIDIYGNFKNGDKEVEKLIASIPAPCPDLTWVISKIKYTPRISCYRDYFMVIRQGNTVSQGSYWSYDIEKEEFTVHAKKCDPYTSLNNRSICLLEAVLGEKLTENNFKEGLAKLPEFHRDSIYNYGFKHIDMFFDIIRSGKKFANPLKNIHLAVNLIFMKQSDTFNESTKLALSLSSIFSLENYRTIVYKYTTNTKATGKKASFVPSFTFVDTKHFFDAFKTTTSKDAGRHRLLLDNVNIHDDMLFVTDKDGVEHNMFELIFRDDIQTENISVISSSAFCNNNDPKRIMMNAKLSAQSIPVVGQNDEFTNKVPARVVFGDFYGYSFADAIIISESFAKKLRGKQIFNAECNIRDTEGKHIFNRLQRGNYDLSIKDLRYLMPNKNDIILKGYENVVVKYYEPLSTYRVRLLVQAEIPFLPGDKITNFHGAKGVCGLILPDDQMPCLKNDIGDFKAGPFDVIFSGYSVFRRGSLGGLFEAWARATGKYFEKGEDFAKVAIEKYRDEIKDFSKKSIITLNGEESIKPCGIIDIIRLYHHATTKVSQSYIKTNSNKMLKLGEQEKLNLLTNECTDALREISIRSTHKHEDAFYLIYNIMKTRRLPKHVQLSSNFARMLKTMGYNMELNDELLIKSDNSIPEELQIKCEKLSTEVSNNELLDLDALFDKKED